MSENVRTKATEAPAEVEQVTQALLPEPTTALVPLADADAPVAAEIEKAMGEIDMTDTNSIVRFGSGAQAELQEISQAMLADVKNKDVGPAGDSLRDIVSTIRGFNLDELGVGRKQSWWDRLVGRAKPMAMFVAKFETVQGQIDKITEDLLEHEHVLLKDIKSLDKLYEKTLEFYDQLAVYLAAGEEKLRVLDETEIPAKAAEVDAAPENEQLNSAMNLALRCTV